MDVDEELEAKGSTVGKGGTIVVTTSGEHTGSQAVMRMNTLIRNISCLDVILRLTELDCMYLLFFLSYQELKEKDLTSDKFASTPFSRCWGKFTTNPHL